MSIFLHPFHFRRLGFYMKRFLPLLAAVWFLGVSPQVFADEHAVTLNLKNADIRSVVEMVAKVTGK